MHIELLTTAIVKRFGNVIRRAGDSQSALTHHRDAHACVMASMLKQGWALFSPSRGRADPEEHARRIATLFDALVLTTRANEQFPQQAQILNFGDGPRDGQLLLGAEGQVRLGPELGGGDARARAAFARAVLDSVRLRFRDSVQLCDPIVKAMRGAATRRHNDAFRGARHANLVLFLDPGASLVLRIDVAFRASLVRVDGAAGAAPPPGARPEKLFVPFALVPASRDEGEMLVMIAPRDDAPGEVRLHVFDGDVLESLVCVANLDAVAVRVSDDFRHVLTAPLGEVAGELVPVAFDALVARSTPAKASAPRYVRVGTAGQWELFEGWRFVHHLEGDQSARRVHIVNRAMPDPLADLRQADGAREGIPGVFGVDPVDCRRRGAPS